MHKSIISIVVALLVFSGIAQAQTNPDQCVSDANNIYYINGVDTGYSGAYASLKEIATAYESIFASDYPDQRFEFTVSYNATDGLEKDLAEFIRGKAIERGMLTLNSLHKAYNFLRKLWRLDTGQMTASERQLAEGVVGEEARRTKQLMDAGVLASSHTSRFRTDLSEGRKVLIIPHSQGNLFANEAMATLISEYARSIRAVGVATPASRTVNNSTYVTANDDRVINALRSISIRTLRGNIDNDPGILNDSRGFLNHAFIKGYFSQNLPSRTEINRLVHATIGALEFPSGTTLGTGPITVALEWGSQPDVDLHIYEPNGTHVYYSNKRGTSGFLDRDDTTGFGPEHYFVGCDTLETGVYRVGVNYYNGNAPETARIQISTGDGRTRSHTQRLITDRGSRGNNSPFIVATITVARGANGQYTYTVNRS